MGRKLKSKYGFTIISLINQVQKVSDDQDKVIDVLDDIFRSIHDNDERKFCRCYRKFLKLIDKYGFEHYCKTQSLKAIDDLYLSIEEPDFMLKEK